MAHRPVEVVQRPLEVVQRPLDPLHWESPALGAPCLGSSLHQESPALGLELHMDSGWVSLANDCFGTPVTFSSPLQ